MTRPYMAFGHQPPGRTCFADATNGSDLSSGSAGAPVKTIAPVFAFLKPGDQILLKRGETFAEQLAITKSGLPGQPIVFGAYGTGAKPIIRYNSATHADALLTSIHHVVLDNIDFDGTGGYWAMYMDSCHDMIVNACDFHAAGYQGAYVTGSAASAYNIQFNACTGHHNGQWAAIEIGYGDTGNIKGDYQGPHDITIRDGSFYSNGADPAADHGLYIGFSCFRVNVINNDIYSNAGAGIKFNSSRDAFVSRNRIRLNYRALTLAAETALGWTCGGHQINNNLAYTQTNCGLYMDGSDANLIYYNTFINNSTVTNNASVVWNSALAINNIVKNNIFAEDHVLDPYTLPLKGSTGIVFHNTNTFSNNDWAYIHRTAEPIRENGNYYTLAAWQALGADAGSINADPVFATAYTDLHLQTTSPCKNAGDATVGVVNDFDGIVRGAAVDIGAYEYV
jgi:hypothetical protein